MAKQNSRYRQMERYMTYAILAALLFFILFWISAGAGVIWAKVITAIFTALITVLSLLYLFITKELLRPRSLWMTAASGSILLCLLFALLLNFPSPNPYDALSVIANHYM